MKAGQFLTFGLLSMSVSLSVTLLTSAKAWADEVFPKAYEANYESKNSQGTTQLRMLSNGKGLTRTETSAPGGMKAITIADFKNHTSATILEGQKMIVKGKFDGKSASTIDAAEAKKLNATDLGSKMVNGHMAQGWSYKDKNSSTEVWIAKDAGLMVKSITVASGLRNEMNIKTLTLKAPDEAVFKVPTSGYKVMGQ